MRALEAEKTCRHYAGRSSEIWRWSELLQVWDAQQIGHTKLCHQALLFPVLREKWTALMWHTICKTASQKAPDGKLAELSYPWGSTSQPEICTPIPLPWGFLPGPRQGWVLLWKCHMAGSSFKKGKFNDFGGDIPINCWHLPKNPMFQHKPAVLQAGSQKYSVDGSGTVHRNKYYGIKAIKKTSLPELLSGQI